MPDLTSLKVPVPPELLLLIGTGGGGRTRTLYRDGAATEELVQRDGAAVHRLSGVAVSVAGVGMDGAIVETTTPLETVEAGTIFRVEGAAELTVRADVRPGFGDRGPRGTLAVSVYAQTLTPVGTVDQLLRSGSRRGGGE
ncbi:hypothetical protein [Mycobacterium sp. ACS4331]|uniref:hypothetical protein n=1 Tax=Mycobacterium sp. ACS4331 TaxID=1834121 RepID=UPI0009EE3B7D|nr:hypothetical protein [Mycobacterium sp. ACS4331]